MTTSVKIHVNGRYRAIVKQNDLEPVVIEGNYEGSPNPSGEKVFWLIHGDHNTFDVTEEYVSEVARDPELSFREIKDEVK